MKVVVKKMKMRGGDFFSDVGNAFNDAVNVVKNSHIVSDSASYVGGVVGGLFGPEGVAPGAIIGTAVGNVARQNGWGPMRGGARRMSVVKYKMPARMAGGSSESNMANYY